MLNEDVIRVLDGFLLLRLCEVAKQSTPVGLPLEKIEAKKEWTEDEVVFVQKSQNQVGAHKAVSAGDQCCVKLMLRQTATPLAPVFCPVGAAIGFFKLFFLDRRSGRPGPSRGFVQFC